MKKVLIIGASGNIASLVTEILLDKKDIQLTLFVRNKNRLTDHDLSKAHIIEGSAMNYESVTAAVKGQDIVYVNLAGHLEKMAQNITRAMKEGGVSRVIFISSIGIYDTPLKSVIQPYRKGADVFESSGLDYTILRPAWFTNDNEVDYEITYKGEPEKGSLISKKSLATFIAKIIEFPSEYSRKNLGINKP
jgi:uncharacterized protein YbjT (DUF2867 family)